MRRGPLIILLVGPLLRPSAERAVREKKPKPPGARTDAGWRWVPEDGPRTPVRPKRCQRPASWRRLKPRGAQPAPGPFPQENPHSLMVGKGPHYPCAHDGSGRSRLWPASGALVFQRFRFSFRFLRRPALPPPVQRAGPSKACLFRGGRLNGSFLHTHSRHPPAARFHHQRPLTPPQQNTHQFLPAKAAPKPPIGPQKNAYHNGTKPCAFVLPAHYGANLFFSVNRESTTKKHTKNLQLQ